MFELKLLGNDDVRLQGAPLIRAAMLLLSYLTEHQTIGLTQTKAFQRKFVHWAAEAFEWPGFDLERYFAISKVMNEYDYPPLEMLHFLLLKLKLVRHYKSTCRLTKLGTALADKPGDLFNMIAPFYLFQIDHAASSVRFRDPLPGNWNVFLGVLNVEAEYGISNDALRAILYGPAEKDQPYDDMSAMIHSQILTPLCWMGLLTETDKGERSGYGTLSYIKTPLWNVALDFPYDPVVTLPTRHPSALRRAVIRR